MSSAYEGLARFYDALTGDVRYQDWLEWYIAWFQRSSVPVEIVLDLACGTGTLTCMLAERGYSMIGTDQSESMLGEAMDKAYDLEMEDEDRPLFLRQSMEKLDMYGTIDACVCSLDSINYVTDPAALQEAFRRVHTFLMPHGYFLFDVLTPARLARMGGQTFVDETEDVLCLWRASFDEGEGLLTYGMDLFERNGELWQREQEEHFERAWQPEQLKQWLTDCGFAEVQIFGGTDGSPVTAQTERLFFVCTNGEGGQTRGQTADY